MYSYIIKFKVHVREKDSSLEDAANRELKKIKDKGYTTKIIDARISENMKKVMDLHLWERKLL